MVNQACQYFFIYFLFFFEDYSWLFEGSISTIFSATSLIYKDGYTKAFHQTQAVGTSFISLSLDFIIAEGVCKLARWLTYESRSCSSWNAIG